MATTQELANILSQHMKTKVKMADDEVYNSGFWPTGILPIDANLGGGFAKGRMGLVAGESATLKSLIGLCTIASTQRLGGSVALFDTEHAFNKTWATKVGVNSPELILEQPDTGEEAVDKIEVLVRNGIDLVVFDSIAAMLPNSDRAIMLSGKDNPQPARIAALMSIALRKLNSANEKTTIVWITQKRANIGAMAFSPKSLNTGGNAITYYASQIIELKKAGRLYKDITYWNGDKDATDKQIIAQGFRAENTKSRNKQPFDINHFVFDLTTGKIDLESFLMAEGLDLGVITKKGAWWTYTDVDKDGVVLGEHKAGSKDKFKELVSTNNQVYNSLLQRICSRYDLEVDNYGGLRET